MDWEAPSMGCQAEMVLENRRVQNWEIHFAKNLELMKDLTRACQKGMLRENLGPLQIYLSREQGWT